MTYPLAFRKKVLSVKKEQNLTYEQTAKRFDIGKNSIVLWNRNIKPKSTKNRPSIKLDLNLLVKDVKENPDSYQYERAEKFKVSKSCIQAALMKLKISFKKRPFNIQMHAQKKEKNT